MGETVLQVDLLRTFRIPRHEPGMDIWSFSQRFFKLDFDGLPEMNDGFGGS